MLPPIKQGSIFQTNLGIIESASFLGPSGKLLQKQFPPKASPKHPTRFRAILGGEFQNSGVQSQMNSLYRVLFPEVIIVYKHAHRFVMIAHRLVLIFTLFHPVNDLAFAFSAASMMFVLFMQANRPAATYICSLTPKVDYNLSGYLCVYSLWRGLHTLSATVDNMASNFGQVLIYFFIYFISWCWGLV